MRASLTALAFSISLAPALAPAAPSGAVAGPSAVPSFAVVRSCGEAAPRCMLGRYPPDVEVLLVSAEAVCSLRTGKAASWRPREAGGGEQSKPATALAGTCSGEFPLAAVGGRASSFSRVARLPVTSPVRMEALLEQIAAARAVDRAFEEAQARGETTRKDQLADGSPSEAFTLAGVPGSPSFVRFPLADGDGPLLVVERDDVRTPFNVCSSSPLPFRLGDRVFVYTVSRCCACDWRAELVHELAGGKLREVFAGTELPDARRERRPAPTP